MSLCLIAIFKNESHIMKEWINHYINQGVDKFYLIDNGSTDNYLEILTPFIIEKRIELVKDNTRHAQTKLYNKYFLEKSKRHEWALVCDLDEFVYARNGYKTIKSYLNALHKTVTQIFIPWKMFGSNGYNDLDKPQPESVIQSFTKRTDYDKTNIKYNLSKCIVRTSKLKWLWIHYHTTIDQNYILSNNKIKMSFKREKLEEQFSEISEKTLTESYLHLNHYAIQSFDWFMRVKATRGSSETSKNENLRDEKYFREYDMKSNEIDDFELRNNQISSM
jgi:hypothetical protein